MSLLVFLLQLASPRNAPARRFAPKSPTFFPRNADIPNSKLIATPPVLTLLSAYEWGSFGTSGPSSDQTIRFAVSGPSDISWSFFKSFDAETMAFVQNGTAAIASLTVRASEFTGQRTNEGAHLISVVARDASTMESNTIVVSYRISRSHVFTIIGIVVLAMLCLAAIGSGAWCIWRWRCPEAQSASLMGDSSGRL
jgi:hypothetical protein